MQITLDTSTISAVTGAIVGAGAATTVLWVKLIRPLQEAGTRLGEFVDDWRGRPSRPGVPGQLGVMERLAGIDQMQANQADSQKRQDSRLDSIEHELKTNGGGTLRDELREVKAKIAVLAEVEQRPIVVQLATGNGEHEQAREGKAAA